MEWGICEAYRLLCMIKKKRKRKKCVYVCECVCKANEPSAYEKLRIEWRWIFVGPFKADASRQGIFFIFVKWQKGHILEWLASWLAQQEGWHGTSLRREDSSQSFSNRGSEFLVGYSKPFECTLCFDLWDKWIYLNNHNHLLWHRRASTHNTTWHYVAVQYQPSFHFDGRCWRKVE